MNAPSKHDAFDLRRQLRDPPILPVTLLVPSQVERPAEFLILLLPGFSQLCLSSFTDVFWLANSISGRKLFHWRVVSLDGTSVESASGISVCVSGGLQEAMTLMQLDARGGMMICYGEDVERHGSCRTLGPFLRSHARKDVPLYATGAATWLLAEADLLENTRCTIHWGKRDTLAKTFYNLDVDDALFIRDGPVVTCAGELAALDLAIDLVRERFGDELACDVCNHVTADRRRDGATCQPVSVALRFAGMDAKFVEILALMEANIGRPLSIADISKAVALSRRQIDRLFDQHLSTTPWKHYVTLRLSRAKHLIATTAIPLAEIAAACGFVSVSHFGKCFRDRFSVQPGKLRRCLKRD